ncbi:MAG: homing endonuclease associated repeat-containing protein [Anaerovoracaceae bacterium]|jgi:hypothetical protein
MTFDELLASIPEESPAANGKPANYYRDQAAARLLSKLTDEELLGLIREANEQLGRPPKKSDIPGFQAFKNRFGPWPRLLEKAGVKEPSPTKLRREQAKRNKRKNR